MGEAQDLEIGLAELPVWDREGLSARLLGDADLLVMIRDTFLVETPKQLAVLKERLDGQEPDRAARQAHLIKGAAGTVGADRLRAVADRMEQAARGGGTHELAALWLLLGRELEKVRLAMTGGA